MTNRRNTLAEEDFGLNAFKASAALRLMELKQNLYLLMEALQ